MRARWSQSAPIYVQIATAIRRRIRSGKLKTGDRLESERQLAANFGASLMTVRQALQSLEEEGLLERKHGSGTYVRTPPIHWNRLLSFTEQMALRKIKASSEVLALSVVPSDHLLAEQLRVSPGAALVQVERLRRGDGEPLALEICVLPLSLFPGLDREPLQRRSLFEILEQRYGMQLAHAVESIESRLADKRVARALGVDPRCPMLFLRQQLFSTDGQPIAISTGWYRGDKNVFKVIRSRLEAGPRSRRPAPQPGFLQRTSTTEPRP
ncbi:MAG TPA: GntR family transcriptional regulator [Bryobacteraceae bacterium]|nr:GntR family transcriptional regulator [Bryobacteraceae bacterium]